MQPKSTKTHKNKPVTCCAQSGCVKSEALSASSWKKRTMTGLFFFDKLGWWRTHVLVKFEKKQRYGLEFRRPSRSLSLSLSLFFFTIILIRAALAQPRPVESIRRFRRLIVPPRPSLERFAGAVQVSANPMRPIGFDGCRCVITRFDGLLTSDAAFLSHFANREQKQNVHTLNALNAPSRIRPDGFHRICMDRLRADSAANKLRNKEH